MKLIEKNSTHSYKVYMQEVNNNFYIAAYSYGVLIAAIRISDKNKPIFITDTIDYSVSTQKHLRKFVETYDFQGKDKLIFNFWKSNLPYKSIAKQLFALVDKKVIRHAKSSIDFDSYTYYASIRHRFVY